MKVFSLWIGELTELEIFSMNCFLKLGIEYELYSYTKLKNVPVGVIECDANDILPEFDIFEVREYNNNKNKLTYTEFADLWRYKKLAQDGGIWVDLDFIPSKNFLEIDKLDYFFASENKPNKLNEPLNCLIKFNKHSSFCKLLYEKSLELTKNKRVHLGLLKLFARLVKKNNLKISEYWRTTPINFSDIHLLKKNNINDLVKNEFILKNCYGVHLYNSKWKRRPILKGDNLTNKLNEIFLSIN